MTGRGESFFAAPSLPSKKVASPTLLRNPRTFFFEHGEASVSVTRFPSPPATANHRSSHTSADSLAETFDENLSKDAPSNGDAALKPSNLVETQTLPENDTQNAETEEMNERLPMSNSLSTNELIMTPDEAMHHIQTHDVGELFDGFSNTFNGLLAEKHPILTKHVDTLFNCNKIFHTHRTLLEHRREALHKRKIEALVTAEKFRKKCLVAVPECQAAVRPDSPAD